MSLWENREPSRPKGGKVHRVQRGGEVHRVQRVVVAADAADFKEKGRGSAAGCVEGLYSLRSGGDSGSAAEGCGLPLCGNAYKVSVTGLTFSVIWQNNHSADWLAALATPYPGCAGLPPIQGEE